MSFVTKYLTKKLLTKNLKQKILLTSSLNITFHFFSHATEINNQNYSKEKTIVSQNENSNEIEKKSKQPAKQLDPTEDVAGGIGEEGYQAPKYAVLPTGKTLPKGIFKVDVPIVYTFGSKGFDGNGDSVNNGLTMNRWISGLFVNYGVSKTVSIGVGIPYFVTNQMSMDGNTIAANSEMYQRYYSHVLNDLSTKLSAGSGTLCGGHVTQASCANYINSGGPMPNSPSLTITLPTGETFTFNSSSPLKDQIKGLLLNAAQTSNGATGIGDIQFGVLWNLVSEESPWRHMPLYFSVGGGLRIPTGQFNVVDSLRSNGGDATLISGGGTYDAILRWNLDYIVTPGVIFSWQHVAEYSLTSAILNRSSMINNNNFNNADPTASGGDGQGNTLTFTRKGLHHVGFLQAAWGLGNIEENLKWLGLYTQAKYNIAARAYLNGQPVYVLGDQFYLGESAMHPDHGAEQYYSVVAGTKFSGLPYRIPLETTAEFEYPYAGANRAVSPMNMKIICSLYF